jgi:hypothetical protein
MRWYLDTKDYRRESGIGGESAVLENFEKSFGRL